MKTVIEMAREAGKEFGLESMPLHPVLERFAELVRAEAVRENSAEYRMGWNDGQISEREQCAKLAESLYADARADEIEFSIRARSNT